MMKAVFRSICVFLLVLCVSPLRAETITHNFQAKTTAKEIAFSNSYKTGTIGDTVYTCSGGATFGADEFYKSVIAINLPSSSSEVVVSPAIEGLTQVRISHYPNTECPNLKVYISTDGTSWGDPLPADAMGYGLGTTFADVPKGNYYLKFANSSSTQLSIIEIRYTTDPSSCACLQVVSQ